MAKITKYKIKPKKKPVFKLPRDMPPTDPAILCQTCGEVTEKKIVFPDNRDRFYITYVCQNGHNTNREYKRFKPKI